MKNIFIKIFQSGMACVYRFGLIQVRQRFISFDVNHNVIDTVLEGKNKIYSAFVSPEPRINFKYSIMKTHA